MSHVPQDRFVCPRCGACGWWTPSTHIGPSPLQDHDRPDGRKCRAPIGTLPSADSVLEIHEWTFTGRVLRAFGPHSERVRFYALPGQASDRAWEALLASGAYERGEHYVPVIRARLGRKPDARSGAAIGALAVARSYVVEGMPAAQALETVARHYPQALTALEIAYLSIEIGG